MPKTNRSDSSSALSPSSTGPQPSWPAPKAPLSPHRLAKLANALGVATPVPASGTLVPSLASNISSSGLTLASPLFPHDARGRSPTPSVASSHLPAAPSTSRYLLHVIPPRHLPHDTDTLAPIPLTASGYHTQFRRGVLVPVYSTLQSQLTAIAREYALPSTVGMVLYLITTMNAAHNEEPGPRISEDIWKHIWARVVRAEKDEIPAPGPKPFGLGLGYGVAGRSSPALLQDVTSNPSQQPQNLRAFVSSQLPEISPLTPSPSTPSQSPSPSDVDTPDSASSVAPSTDASSLPLPGLESPALVPVLAKVEFDIDRRNAEWYKAWVRSRRITHAKRAESRVSGRSRSLSENGEGGEEGEEGTKKAPIDLRLVDRMNKRANRPAFLVTEEKDEGYELLEDEGNDDLTARLDAMGADGDPLDDVFGTDAETWAEMRAEPEARQNNNPNVVDLALDAAAVSNLPDDLEEGDESCMSVPDDEADVSELLNRMPKPPLTVAIPSEEEAAVLAKRRSEPATAGTVKKHVPPPLHLMLQNHGELGVPEQSPQPSSASSARLAYLASPSSDVAAQQSEPETNPHISSHSLFPDEDDDEDEDELDEELLKNVNIRSPEDEKRDGAVFGDLDLGLDPSITDDGDYDDSDPYDRRKSQYIMAAQLDEIEKNLAQFSPRPHLQSIDMKTEDIPVHRRDQSNASMRSPSLTLSPRKGDVSPPLKSPGATEAAWPAVPYSALSNKDEDRLPSPPTFAFNGITTEPPKQFQRRSTRSDAPSNETVARQRALAEDSGLYPPLTAPNMFGSARSLDSPVIPLSPDPFGRYPSEAEASRIESERNSQSYSDDGSTTHVASFPDRTSSLATPSPVLNDSRPQSRTPSSRFSMESDEIAEVVNARANSKPSSSSLMSVKNIRKLWRKSDVKRESVSTQAKPESRPVSPNMPPPAPPVPQPQFQPQPTGRSRAKSISKSSIPASEYPPFVPASIPPRETMRALCFDQESPYPVHPVRPVRSPSPPRPVPQQAPPTPGLQRNSVRKSILKSLRGGSLSAGSAKSSISSTTSRSSTEQQQAEPTRKRKPSILYVSVGAMRSSPSLGSAASFGDIPPSPMLPEQYVQHNRSASRHSQGRRPSMSSNASASSPPRVRSPLLASSSPPRNGLAAVGRQSHASDSSFGSRPSVDVSQFEIVSPPNGSLSYPYNGLDLSVLASRE